MNAKITKELGGGFSPIKGSISPRQVEDQDINDKITIATSFVDCPKEQHHHLYNHKYLQFMTLEPPVRPKTFVEKYRDRQ